MSSVMSKLFGGGGRAPATVLEPVRPQTQNADIAREETLKRLAKLRRATLTAELSQANVKRTVLGAGRVA